MDKKELIPDIGVFANALAGIANDLVKSVREKACEMRCNKRDINELESPKVLTSKGEAKAKRK